MTVDEKLQQLQLLSDGQITDADAKAGVGGGLQPHRPGEDQPLPARRGRAVAAAHPDPVRLRHDPRLPHDLPGPAGRREQLRPVGRHRGRHRSARARRRPSASSRSTARWSTSRTSRAGAASPRPPARTRTSARSSRPRASRPRRATTTRAPDKVVTSVKHFAAYGQPEGGRDYNTTDMSEQRLRNLYLPPFKAAIDAGADTVMCSFNAINGVPGCANHETETRHPQGASGASTASSRATTPPSPSCAPARRRTRTAGPCGHGVAADGPDAAQAALNAGTDSEMVSTNIRDFGKQLLAQHRISMAAHRRRGAADPAREVPRRAVRAPLRRPGEGRRSEQLRDRRRPRRGARRRPASRWSCSRTTARRRSRSTRPSRSP